jgi:hypothetical protein
MKADENRVRRVQGQMVVAFLVDDGFRQAHVFEELEDLDRHRGDGDDAEFLRHQQLRQDQRREKGDQVARE